MSWITDIWDLILKKGGIGEGIAPNNMNKKEDKKENNKNKKGN